MKPNPDLYFNCATVSCSLSLSLPQKGKEKRNRKVMTK
jgi:hypothetical protein